LSFVSVDIIGGPYPNYDALYGCPLA